MKTPPSGSEYDSPRESEVLMDGEPGIDLRALVERVWVERARLCLVFLAAGFSLAALLAAVYAFRPTHTEARVAFRLLFEGVGIREYPDKTPFASSDIVSTSVLQEVYRRNPLSAYVPFEEFKSSFSVLESGPSLERLQREYQERLGLRTLTPADRQRIEGEYSERARELGSSEFTLVARLGEGLQRWPTVFSGKILSDVLAVWAEQSAARGIFGFNVSVLSTNALPKAGDTDEPLILVNRIRMVARRILADIQELSQVPGANLLRAGEKQVTLLELNARVQDLLQFDVGTIDALVAEHALVQNPLMAEAFLDEQIARMDTEMLETRAKMEVRNSAHASYVAPDRSTTAQDGTTAFGQAPMIAQLSDGFLDRMLELTQQNSDARFRQELTEKVIEWGEHAYAREAEKQLYAQRLDLLKASRPSTSDSAELAAWTRKETADVLSALEAVTRDLQSVHHAVAATRFQPSMAYTVVEPLRRYIVSPVGIKTAAMGAIALFLVFGGLATVITAMKARKSR